MTNEQMLITYGEMFVVHSKEYNSSPGGYVELRITLDTDWDDEALENARLVSDWLKQEAFPKEKQGIDYREKIELLDNENKALRSAYDEMRKANESLAFELYTTKQQTEVTNGQKI